MAGSYNHVVEDDGGLSSNRRVAGMLENGGDVFEAVEEMYGMIWYLAHELAKDDKWKPEDYEGVKKYFVEEARKGYKEGLEVSPTRRYHHG